MEFEAKAPGVRRLFFALWPPQALQHELFQLAGRVLGAADGRRIVMENIHLTLAFLGAVEEDRRACCERAAAAVRGVPFSLRLERVGCFRRTGVLWAGPAQTPPPLIALVDALGAALAACGYVPEQRVFRPHLTLVRKVRCPPHESACPALDWAVKEFVLVESRPAPDGAYYQVLERFALEGKAKRGMRYD